MTDGELTANFKRFGCTVIPLEHIQKQLVGVDQQSRDAILDGDRAPGKREVRLTYPPATPGRPGSRNPYDRYARAIPYRSEQLR